MIAPLVLLSIVILAAGYLVMCLGSLSGMLVAIVLIFLIRKTRYDVDEYKRIYNSVEELKNQLNEMTTQAENSATAGEKD